MYIVIELQTLNDEQVANIVTAYTVKETAEQKYHTVLAAAAVSTLPCHAAIMMNERGDMLKHEYYTHTVEPQPTPAA